MHPLRVYRQALASATGPVSMYTGAVVAIRLDLAIAMDPMSKYATIVAPRVFAKVLGW